MNGFVAGCRVKCIDATPLPINVRGAVATDFSFPGGYIGEGAVYCVESVGISNQGRPCLRLVGHPVLHLGVEISWDSLRFRKVETMSDRSRRRRRRKQPDRLDARRELLHS